MKWLLLAVAVTGCELLPRTVDVACEGPKPMSCECVRACSFTEEGGAELTGVLATMTTELCVPRCWDRSK